MKNKFKLSIVWLFLVLSLLACRLGMPNAIEVPDEVIPVSTEAVEQLREAVRSAEEQLQSNGRAELQVTETQLTSFVTFQLQEQGISDLTEPQVYLRSGQILVSGRYQGNVSITAAVAPSASNGNIRLQIVSAQLGPAPAPSSMISRAQNALDEQVAPALQNWLSVNFYIESLTVSDGVMTLSGVKP